MNPAIIIENSFRPSDFIAATAPVGVAASVATGTIITGSDLAKIAGVVIIALVIFAVVIYNSEESRKRRSQQELQTVQ